MSSEEKIKELITIFESSGDPDDLKKANQLREVLSKTTVEKDNRIPEQKQKQICPSCAWVQSHHYEFDWLPKHENPDKNRYVCHYD